MLSHDWPATITSHGDLPGLLRAKPFFRADIQSGRLGSPPLWGLLMQLRPLWWFAAHLHVRFEAVVSHEGAGIDESAEATAAGDNPDEIAIDDADDAPNSQPTSTLANPDKISMDDIEEGAPVVEPVVSKIPVNPDEIVLDDLEEDIAPPPRPRTPPEPKAKTPTGPKTRFIALDKCLPRRQFLEVSSTF